MSLLPVLLIIALCLFLSAFFSGAETAFMVADRIRLRHLVEKGDGRAKVVENLRSRPERFLGTALVGTNLAVVGASVLATRVIGHLLGHHGTLGALIETCLMTPLVLIFAEIIPKNLFRLHADSLILGLAPLVRISHAVLSPLVYLTTGFSRLLSREKSAQHHTIPFVTREELRYLARESHRFGLIEKQEHFIVGQIFDFAETTVQEVMVPLEQIVSVALESTPLEVVEIIKREGKSRIPVYGTAPADVVGVVDITHLLTARRNTPLKKLIYPLSQVRGRMSIERLFLQFQKKREHMSLVTDERGKVMGVVTMEDLLERIVGEIRDEHDETRPNAAIPS
jgi:CBS domain containing-hemolysin-like protein